MKKRVFAAIMTTVLVLASVMGVSAADSKEAGVTVTNKSETDTYVIDAVDADEITALGGQEVIDNLNKSDLSDLPNDIAKELKGKTVISNVFDLSVKTGDHAQCEKDGYHTVTLVVDGLTKDIDKDSVRILHFNMEDAKWEIIVPDSVDLATKTLVARFTNLSPVMILAEKVDSSATGTSPSTAGTSSAWMLIAALAVVALGAGVVASQKKNR